MPIYEFQCSSCGKIQEKIFKINECPQSITCDSCRNQSKKVVCFGAVQGDTPSWLDDGVQGALVDIDSRRFRPIETRSQLKKVMKERGICESPGSGPRWI